MSALLRQLETPECIAECAKNAAMAEKRDLASPEETAKRKARIAEAGPRLRTRLADMYAARELRRQCEILTAWELFTELNSLMSAMRCSGGSDMERYRAALAEVASDLEDDLTGAGEAMALGRESEMGRAMGANNG